MIISVRNWKKFQHYKNRKPPWIKLHLSLLDNPEWHNLAHFANRLLIELWLLAAETDDGVIEIESVAVLAWRLRYASKMLAKIETALHLLKDKEFIDIDSKTLASCKQPDSAETEAERETEERESKRFTPPSVEEVEQYIQAKRYIGTVNAQKFVAFYESKGWMIGKNAMKSWKHAVVNWHCTFMEENPGWKPPIENGKLDPEVQKKLEETAKNIDLSMGREVQR